MIWNAFAVLGILVFSWWAVRHGVFVLRAAFWAVWTCIPVARANPDRVTARRVVKHVALTFWAEWTGWDYDTKSSPYYSHGFWPWEARAWHKMEPSDG